MKVSHQEPQAQLQGEPGEAANVVCRHPLPTLLGLAHVYRRDHGRVAQPRRRGQSSVLGKLDHTVCEPYH